MKTEKETILVMGATGTLGGEVVKQLSSPLQLLILRQAFILLKM